MPAPAIPEQAQPPTAAPRRQEQAAGAALAEQPAPPASAAVEALAPPAAAAAAPPIEGAADSEPPRRPPPTEPPVARPTNDEMDSDSSGSSGASGAKPPAVSTVGLAVDSTSVVPPAGPADSSGGAEGLPAPVGQAPARELLSSDYAVVASGLVLAALIALLLQAPEASRPLLALPLLSAL
ncbi:hypothetical protein ABPG75_013843 [Micractinium tetrahymenae]